MHFGGRTLSVHATGDITRARPWATGPASGGVAGCHPALACHASCRDTPCWGCGSSQPPYILKFLDRDDHPHMTHMHSACDMLVIIAIA
jgi:hypothetical protein